MENYCGSEIEFHPPGSFNPVGAKKEKYIWTENVGIGTFLVFSSFIQLLASKPKVKKSVICFFFFKFSNQINNESLSKGTLVHPTPTPHPTTSLPAWQLLCQRVRKHKILSLWVFPQPKTELCTTLTQHKITEKYREIQKTCVGFPLITLSHISSLSLPLPPIHLSVLPPLLVRSPDNTYMALWTEVTGKLKYLENCLCFS